MYVHVHRLQRLGVGHTMSGASIQPFTVIFMQSFRTGVGVEARLQRINKQRGKGEKGGEILLKRTVGR